MHTAMRGGRKACRAAGGLCAIACAAAGGLFAPRHCEAGPAPLTGAVDVPVAEDATINRANELSNLNLISAGGGLLAGLDDTGSDYGFYLKFALPEFEPGTEVSSARLVGFYQEAIGRSSKPFVGAFFVPDDSWSQTLITASNAPTSAGDSVAGFESGVVTPGREVTFEAFGLAEAADREYRGDGALSLLLSTIDGRFDDLQGFASREFDAAKAFRLELELTTEGTNPIPLPPAAWAGGGVLMWLAAVRAGRRVRGVTESL